MKNLLYIIGSSILKNMLLRSSGGAQSHNESYALPKFNSPYLAKLAKRYIWAASSAFVFTLFFVAGISMCLFAAAQSYDLFGVFVPGAAFFTGVAMAAISLLIAGSSLYVIRNTKILKDEIYLKEEEETQLTSPVELLGLVQPFMRGFVNGWKKESTKKSYSYYEPVSPASAGTEKAGAPDLRAV